jgi:hypothetical protein
MVRIAAPLPPQRWTLVNHLGASGVVRPGVTPSRLSTSSPIFTYSSCR